jgi:hypothetical protein
MGINKENNPFSYQRGKLKFTGGDDKDRKSLRIEIILYWSWRILLALAFLISVLR